MASPLLLFLLSPLYTKELFVLLGSSCSGLVVVRQLSSQAAVAAARRPIVDMTREGARVFRPFSWLRIVHTAQWAAAATARAAPTHLPSATSSRPSQLISRNMRDGFKINPSDQWVCCHYIAINSAGKKILTTKFCPKTLTSVNFSTTTSFLTF